MILHQGSLIAEGTTEELASHVQNDVFRLEVELVATRTDIENTLKEMPSITSFEIQEEYEGSCLLLIISKKSPEHLVPILVEKNIGIRMLQKARSELEEIFVSLTKGEA